MSMFPHTVTVYNVQQEIDRATLKETFTNYITVLQGVLVDESKAVNVRESGFEGADAVNLYVPFDVVAVDGITGEPKRYVGPMQFWAAEDKSNIWSLTLNGEGGNTFFVRGVAVEADKDFQAIGLMHDGVYNVTKVDEKDFGGLKHWEVGGA